jgi:hypothetical protein
LDRERTPSADIDPLDVRRAELMPGLQLLQGLQRRLAGSVAGKALHVDVHGHECLAEARRQLGHVELVAKDPQEAELAFDPT